MVVDGSKAMTDDISSNLPLFSPERLVVSGTKPKILTVSELTRRIKSCLETNLGYVWVSGEVSNLRIAYSGHHYFSLKDDSSQIRCVLWASTAQFLKFSLKDGMEMIIYGRVTVYEKSGEYQMVVDKVEPKGIGAQQLALAQLKERLEKEGLFDTGRKRPLPLLPGCIAVITSPRGAAIHDILNIISRRFPQIEILIYPVTVQGELAPAQIVQAFNDLKLNNRIEVIILARGGGSAEDLSAFNTEEVARAIYHSTVPVVSAVGHEIDLTIADLVADKRAATPSEAAELVVPLKNELVKNLKRLNETLLASLIDKVKTARLRVDALRDNYILQQPAEQLKQYQQRLDELGPLLTRAMTRLIKNRQETLRERAAQLEHLSPLKVLGRGYSITRDKISGQILTTLKQISVDQEILTRLADGEFTARVTKPR